MRNRTSVRSLPSPLWGGSTAEGGRGGGRCEMARACRQTSTPTPALRADPPHKGEGKNAARFDRFAHP